MMKPEQPAQIQKKRAFVVCLISHILYVISIPVWYFIWMFSAMLFDAPGSIKWYSMTMYQIFSWYPYYVIIAIAAAWLFYARRLFRYSYLITLIPILLAVLSFVLMLI